MPSAPAFSASAAHFSMQRVMMRWMPKMPPLLGRDGWPPISLPTSNESRARGHPHRVQMWMRWRSVRGGLQEGWELRYYDRHSKREFGYISSLRSGCTCAARAWRERLYYTLMHKSESNSTCAAIAARRRDGGARQSLRCGKADCRALVAPSRSASGQHGDAWV